MGLSTMRVRRQPLRHWNGTAFITTFVSSGRLTAIISASDLAKNGTAQVSVTNPSGGGTSQSLTFAIK